MVVKAEELLEKGSLAKESEPPMRGSLGMLSSVSLKPLLLEVIKILWTMIAYGSGGNLVKNSI